MALTQAATPTQSKVMSRDEAVARANDLAAELRGFVDEAETLRRMPVAAVDAIMASGLMPLVRPPHYGGYGLDWATVADCLEPIGRLSGSLAWCTGFLIQHQWILSYFPQSIQDEVYSTHPDPKIVTSFAPSGKMTKVAGGYRVNGVWSFGSGGDHSDWAILAAMLQTDGPPNVFCVLLKPGQFHMRDVWHSVGLKGSGSNDIVVDDVFIADDCAIELSAAMMGKTTGRPDIKGAIYETGIASQFMFGLLNPLLGVARGALDAFVHFTADKVHMSGGKKAESPLMQMRVGQSAAEIDAAYAIVRRFNDRVIAGEMKGPQAGAQFLGGVGMASSLILAACDRLHNAAGARGLGEDQVFGRHWRDVRAMTAHAALQSDGHFQAYGRSLLLGPVSH